MFRAALTLLLLAVLCLGPAAEARKAASAAAAPPARAFDPLAEIARHGFPEEQVGFVLFDAATGAVEVTHRAQDAFIPASVTKVPTTILALAVLGPDHRFTTRLVASAPPVDGVLKGDLWLVGGGDPLLDHLQLARMVESAIAGGLRRVQGRFLYDDGLLPRITVIEPTQPLAVRYNPGVSALSVNFNTVQLAWTTRRGQLSPSLSAVAGDSVLPVETIGLVTGGAGVSRRVPFLHEPLEAPTGPAGGPIWRVSTDLGAKAGQSWLPLRDPAPVAAELVQRLAEARGLSLPAPHPAPLPQGGIGPVLGEQRSLPLAEVSRLVLKHSNNLAAELVGLGATRVLAAEAASPPLQSLAQSAAEAEAWFRARYPETDWRGWIMPNHSGLSSAARITPWQAAILLQHGRHLSSGGLDYRGFLKPVGWAAALTEAAPRGAAPQVVGKSGTMYYARAFQGFMTTAAGRELGYALFITDPDQRHDLDAEQDPEALVTPDGAGAWLGRARALEEALLTGWALTR